MIIEENTTTGTPAHQPLFSSFRQKRLADDRARANLARWTGVPSLTSILFRPIIGRWPLWLCGAMITATALGLITYVVYRTGGTAYAYPYLILLPVIFAATLYKIPGGLVTAFAAALLLGPWMPLDVASGTMQTTHNWLVRMVMYLIFGGFAGVLATINHYRHRRAIAHERTDPITGLVEPVTAGRIISSDSAPGALGYVPSSVVVVACESYGGIVRAMGIDAGNDVVNQIGQMLTELVGHDILVTRTHGATFGILLPSNWEEILLLIGRIQQVIPQAIRVENFSVLLLLRFGIATICKEDHKRGQPFRKALVALQAAQDNARQIAHCSETMDSDARDNIELLSDFGADLSRGVLDIYFQPKLDIVSNCVIGAEALIRWTSVTRGAVSPGRFVPLVEKTTLVDSMTRFVIHKTATTLAEWRAIGLDLEISINLSTHNLLNAEFIDLLVTVPNNYGIPASSIELEITETALVHDMRVVRESLEYLRESGFTIAIDDFGIGYSSFSYLKELPVDWVKLDQSFVRDLPGRRESREISAAAAAMCRRLNYKIIAEGVENQEALDYLRSQNFDAVQGYFLARPMPAKDFLEWIGQQNHKRSAPLRV